MTATSPPTDASNAELVRWYLEAVNRHDLAAMRQLWGPQTVERFPDRTCVGDDEIAAYFEDVFAATPDMHMEVVAVAEQGDDVFAHWHMTATHSGPLLGIEATGKAIAIDGIDHFVLRERQVVSNFVVFDQMQYARQIGMMPADASVADKALKTAFNARTKLAEKLRR